MQKNILSNIFSDRMKVIWYNWVIIQILVLCFFISACAAAAQYGGKGYGFTVVWSALIALLVSVGGTLILRRIDYRVPVFVGALIASGFMMANLSLICAVSSGSLSYKPGGVAATQAFGVLLFLGYSTFSSFVAVWREILIPPSLSGQDEAPLPPAQPAPIYTNDAATF